MNHTKQTHTEPTESKQLTRSERLRKRGLPVIALGVSALVGLGLVAQTFINEQKNSASVTAQREDDKFIDDFNKMLDNLSVHNANPNDIVPNSEFTIPNNTVSLGVEAIRVAGLTDSNTELIADSALAISRANLIQPGSEFVLSHVEINGDDQVIVQPAPDEKDDK